MPEIQVDWHSQEEADRLRNLRDRHGMVWRGVLLEGAKHAESIDLFKALLELHPELATPLPTQHDGVNPKRTAATEQLREQILQRQHARSTTDLPVSAFTNGDGEADSDAAGDWSGESDESAAEHETETDADPRTGNGDGTQSIDVTSAVARMQQARTARTHHVQRPVAAEGTRAREYERWDVAEARTVDADGDGAESLHPFDAHDDVEDAARHPDEEEDEDVIDPHYDYGYADGGGY
ncbi:hypothetical protein [Haloglomus halophilum]|uniref:hypothetical protein n=1 Tax=Haloglomus halophilum TaxID=2962672 RepID=UPI0020C9C106|nr:hypothetical protein [Haloglomus halophilum]